MLFNPGFGVGHMRDTQTKGKRETLMYRWPCMFDMNV